MRDRNLTPFFPLPRGFEASSREEDTPSDAISARSLEGQVVGNGRFLLLRKTRHTHDTASFVAKDLLGGIDVELEVHRDEITGYRVGRSDATRTDQTPLPDFWREPSRRMELAAPTDGVWRRIVAWFRG